jgi:hypothetical protein
MGAGTGSTLRCSLESWRAACCPISIPAVIHAQAFKALFAAGPTVALVITNIITPFSQTV